MSSTSSSSSSPPSPTVEELKELKKELSKLSEKIKKHLVSINLSNGYVDPLSNNQLVTSFKNTLFHTDTGREAVYAMRTIRGLLRMGLASLFILRINAWMEYVISLSGLNNRNYSVMVNMLFLFLLVVVIIDIRCLKWEMTNWGSPDPDELYEGPEERENSLIKG